MAELPVGAGEDVLRSVALARGAAGVVTGELDALHTASWRFGFYHDPNCTIFSDAGKLCDFSVDGSGAAMIRISRIVDDSPPCVYM